MSGEDGEEPPSPSSFRLLLALLELAAILRRTQYQSVSLKIMRGVSACFDRLEKTMETTPWTSTA